MKRLVLSCLAVCVWSSIGPAVAAEKTVTLAVENMTCASCPYIVKESLGAVPGVKSVDVSFETQSATVVFEDTLTTLESLTKTTTDAGYPSLVKL